MTAVGAALAAGSIALLCRPGAVPPHPGPAWPRRPAGALAVAGAAVVAHGLGMQLPLVVLCGLGAWAILREFRRRRERDAADRRTEAVIAACDGLAADLRVGLPPIAALESAAADWPEFRGVADAALLGADVPGAIRLLSERPGAAPLGLVAGAWVVAHRSGAGLADAVGLAAITMREDRATARVVQTELASARATAKLLAVLPLGVLMLGRSLGGDPFGFLIGTPVGLACLATGLVLEWCGLIWLDRIAGSVLGSVG